MANTDAPLGFQPSHYRNGTPYNGKTTPYKIADAYNTTIYTGDAVKAASTGVIQLAGAGDTVLGTFRGCEYRNSGGEVVFNKRWVASTSTFNAEGAIAHVIDDKGVVYICQQDSDSRTPAQADVFENFDLISTHTGSSVTGLSKMELDTSTGTTATAQFRCLGFVPAPNNEIGAYAKVLVIVNEDLMSSTTGA